MHNAIRNFGIIILIVVVGAFAYFSVSGSKGPATTTTLQSTGSLTSTTSSLGSTTVSQNIVISPLSENVYAGGPAVPVFISSTTWPYVTYINNVSLSNNGIGEHIYSTKGAIPVNTTGGISEGLYNVGVILLNASRASKDGLHQVQIGVGPSGNLAYANMTLHVVNGSISKPMVSIIPNSLNLTSDQSANITIESPVDAIIPFALNVTKSIFSSNGLTGVNFNDGTITAANGMYFSIITISTTSQPINGTYVVTYATINQTTDATTLSNLVINVK